MSAQPGVGRNGSNASESGNGGQIDQAGIAAETVADAFVAVVDRVYGDPAGVVGEVVAQRASVAVILVNGFSWVDRV